MVVAVLPNTSRTATYILSVLGEPVGVQAGVTETDVAPTVCHCPLVAFEPSADISELLDILYCKLESSVPIRVMVSVVESKVEVLIDGTLVSSVKLLVVLVAIFLPPSLSFTVTLICAEVV